MSQKSNVWDVVWQVVKFILTLGLSHIAKRESRKSIDSNAETFTDSSPKSNG